MEPGDIYCIKSTGEQVAVLSKIGNDIEIRRPKLTRDGIEYYIETVKDFELETVQAHENRNAEYDCLKIDSQLIVKGKLDRVRQLAEENEKVVPFGGRDKSIN